MVPSMGYSKYIILEAFFLLRSCLFHFHFLRTFLLRVYTSLMYRLRRTRLCIRDTSPAARRCRRYRCWENMFRVSICLPELFIGCIFTLYCLYCHLLWRLKSKKGVGKHGSEREDTFCWRKTTKQRAKDAEAKGILWAVEMIQRVKKYYGFISSKVCECVLKSTPS